MGISPWDIRGTVFSPKVILLHHFFSIVSPFKTANEIFFFQKEKPSFTTFHYELLFWEQCHPFICCWRCMVILIRQSLTVCIVIVAFGDQGAVIISVQGSWSFCCCPLADCCLCHSGSFLVFDSFFFFPAITLQWACGSHEILVFRSSEQMLTLQGSMWMSSPFCVTHTQDDYCGSFTWTLSCRHCAHGYRATLFASKGHHRRNPPFDIIQGLSCRWNGEN